MMVKSSEDTYKSITLINHQGTTASFSEYGARWASMVIADQSGCLTDIVLGFDSVEGYINAHEQYHGAIVGRVCGRISNAEIWIDANKYLLSANDVHGVPTPNHLHGGVEGFHKQKWIAELFTNPFGEQGVEFTYVSPDGQEGYPGKVVVRAKYLLRNDNTVELTMEATTNRSTLIDLTNHTFFNLSGSARNSIMNHDLCLNVTDIVECDDQLIPTGRLISMRGESLGFKTSQKIITALQNSSLLPKGERGISLPYVLKKGIDKLSIAAILHSPESGITMTVLTDRPVIQLYNAYLMCGQDVDKFGESLGAFSGVAIETQGYPDAQKHDNFISNRLDTGQKWSSTTEYRFG